MNKSCASEKQGVVLFFNDFKNRNETSTAAMGQ